MIYVESLNIPYGTVYADTCVDETGTKWLHKQLVFLFSSIESVPSGSPQGRLPSSFPSLERGAASIALASGLLLDASIDRTMQNSVTVDAKCFRNVKTTYSSLQVTLASSDCVLVVCLQCMRAAACGVENQRLSDSTVITVGRYKSTTVSCQFYNTTL